MTAPKYRNSSITSSPSDTCEKENRAGSDVAQTTDESKGFASSGQLSISTAPSPVLERQAFIHPPLSATSIESVVPQHETADTDTCSGSNTSSAKAQGFNLSVKEIAIEVAKVGVDGNSFQSTPLHFSTTVMTSSYKSTITSSQMSTDKEQMRHLPLLDRDTSLLAFNVRVLDWAKREDVPLLERLKYLCIVSNNLDEFFEVRIVPYLSQFDHSFHHQEELTTAFEKLVGKTATLVADQYAVFNDQLFDALNKAGIQIVPHGKRDLAQRKWVKNYFQNEVKPLLLPVGLDPAHPFPIVANKSLNFIVRLGGKDAFGRENDIAIVKVPRVLPRIIALPTKMSGKQLLVVTLSSVIRAHLDDLFPGREVLEFSQFRVTRNSDLSVDDDDVENLRMALRRGLEVRNFGQAVRLEESAACPEKLSEFLLKQFKLPPAALFKVHGPVNLGRLMQLIDLAKRDDLMFTSFRPQHFSLSTKNISFFDQLKQGDLLLHQPFEIFDAVLSFLREAVYDPDVLAIRQTIYRTGAHSELMELLREAVRRGKEVLVVVELKARFDEEANINWAEMLEAIGAQVVYGVVGLKTHAKMLSITRRENNRLVHYGHLSTGNYNAKTAKLYTDFSHITADPEINADML